ncbi:FAD-dependent sensor of blue light [Gillisia sp. Hel_I_86]|uniref:BLUF domain-containing protein n=1 Tax=Gillisia sp. Hel_I_86 TaxID=1249981 RepID=UPI0011996577|nr:BLUF domain-containing protein [Gillisia sp. Hel_I_86]TVZ25674.1 FAD-dependent sensor of blue light [Gillisia sp. Hel_I_86]
MFHTICYVSNASKNLVEKDINILFEQVTSFNNSKNIKGILLFSSGSGNIFQILEDNKETINDLFYNQIKLDPRHKNIFVDIEKEYPGSVFNEYSSKFNTIKNTEDLKKIISYLESNKFNSTHEKLKRLLDPYGIFNDIKIKNPQLSLRIFL